MTKKNSLVEISMTIDRIKAEKTTRYTVFNGESNHVSTKEYPLSVPSLAVFTTFEESENGPFSRLLNSPRYVIKMEYRVNQGRLTNVYLKFWS